MGVQDVVARLNKTKPSSTNKANASIPIATPKKKNTLPPSPIPSPTSTIDNAKNHSNDNNGFSSLIQKFGQPVVVSKVPRAPRLPTPPESPVNRSPPKPMIRKDNGITSVLLVNKTIREIEEIFQDLIDQNTKAEACIQDLQSQVERYASDATKVRDYEIRVDYLAAKLEQISDERDFFEQQLQQLSPQFGSTRPITPQSLPDGAADDVLSRKLLECDQGLQLTVMSYVTDLEKQKLEIKGLKQVIDKQDQLINKLEDRTADELLKEQVEVQRIELENKRELLAQLLNEREDLLRKINGGRNSFRKSSMEFLPIMTGNNMRPNSYCSVGSSSGRNTPPLTAPPKQPLPPLPN